MQPTSGSSNPYTSCTLVHVQKKTWNSEKCPNALAKQVTDLYLVQKHAINFHKGELKKGGEKHASQPWWFMIQKRRWISPIQPTTSKLFSEFVIVLERLMRSILKVDEIRLQLLFTPRVSETATLSRFYAADNFSSCAPVAEGNSQQEHHLWRILDMQTAKDRRQRETSRYCRVNKQERQLLEEEEEDEEEEDTKPMAR